jgi:Protein tyrosine and serine/threonine kinase
MESEDGDVDFNEILGEGAFAIVHRGALKGMPVAVKRIENHRLEKNREENALIQLNHPNVIHLFHVKSGDIFR